MLEISKETIIACYRGKRRKELPAMEVKADTLRVRAYRHKKFEEKLNADLEEIQKNPRNLFQRVARMKVENVNILDQLLIESGYYASDGAEKSKFLERMKARARQINCRKRKTMRKLPGVVDSTDVNLSASGSFPIAADEEREGIYMLTDVIIDASAGDSSSSSNAPKSKAKKQKRTREKDLSAKVVDLSSSVLISQSVVENGAQADTIVATTTTTTTTTKNTISKKSAAMLSLQSILPLREKSVRVGERAEISFPITAATSCTSNKRNRATAAAIALASVWKQGSIVADAANEQTLNVQALDSERNQAKRKRLELRSSNISNTSSSDTADILRESPTSDTPGLALNKQRVNGNAKPVIPSSASPPARASSAPTRSTSIERIHAQAVSTFASSQASSQTHSIKSNPSLSKKSRLNSKNKAGKKTVIPEPVHVGLSLSLLSDSAVDVATIATVIPGTTNSSSTKKTSARKTSKSVAVSNTGICDAPEYIPHEPTVRIITTTTTTTTTASRQKATKAKTATAAKTNADAPTTNTAATSTAASTASTSATTTTNAAAASIVATTTATTVGYPPSKLSSPGHEVSSTTMSLLPLIPTPVPSQAREVTSPPRHAVATNGTTVSPNRASVSPNGTTVSPYGDSVSPNGTTISPIGDSVSPNGTTVSPNGTSRWISRVMQFVGLG